MILIHVMGGLGNQLYQYALYEKMKSLGKQVKLDTYAYCDEAGEDKEWRSLELDRFPSIQYDKATIEDRTRLLDNSGLLTAKIRRKLLGRKDRTVRESKEYMPEIFHMDDVYLYGFWNCERYYEDIIPLLQEKIQFPKSGNPLNWQCMDQMQKENAVSIHIRRTDYLTVADGDRYMGICTEEYYRGAMAYIEARVSNPVYYIFSDDVEYARQHYHQDNMHVVDWNGEADGIYDMQLMSRCKYNICANSTFSMWAARLNQNREKIMIRPLHHDNYETTTVAEVKQNWKNWILLDQNGQVCE